MNFIAATLLLFMSEEESFWMLSTIIEDILPPDYYTDNMIGSQADQFVFRYLISKKFPKVEAHMTKSSLDSSLVTRSWFLCLYVDITPIETTLRIWDLLFIEGSKILFRIGLAFIKLNQTHIISIEDDGISLFQAIKEIPKSTYNRDQLIKVACDRIGSLSQKTIEKRRRILTAQLLEENQQRSQRKAARQKA
eukprot:TRINITY_DN815_c0_g1_i2.p1 TRINITY_DN815_c0_g1~~TRINITY_DN815_c0_g1_i2.p1  ORF type:complete len:193 (+),score=25.90 TRINITY_DN815_c0_g1_i2:555-1133(+)